MALAPLNPLTVVDLQERRQAKLDADLKDLADLQDYEPVPVGGSAPPLQVFHPKRFINPLGEFPGAIGPVTPTATPYNVGRLRLSEQIGRNVEGFFTKPHLTSTGESVTLEKVLETGTNYIGGIEGVGGAAKPFAKGAEKLVGPSAKIVKELSSVKGEQIAKQLGVRYDGIQKGLGMQFTDPVTGSTTYGNTLKELETNLTKMRAKFAEAGGAVPLAPKLSEPEAAIIASVEQGNLSRAKQLIKAITTSTTEQGNPFDVPPQMVDQILDTPRPKSLLAAIKGVRADTPELTEAIYGVEGYIKPPPIVDPIGLNPLRVKPSIGLVLRNLARDILAPVPKITGRPFVPEDKMAEAALFEHRRLMRVGENQARIIGQLVGAERRKLFVLDAEGKIPALAGVDVVDGVPGLADVIAHLPKYEAALSPEQLDFSKRLVKTIKEYDDLRASIGGVRDVRPDVMEGGAYIPRGGAEQLGKAAEEPLVTTVKGKPGFLKPIKFGTQAQATGYKYDTPEVAVERYIRQITHDIADLHVAKALKAMAVERGSIPTGPIDFPGVQGLSFPRAMANSMTAMQQSKGLAVIPTLGPIKEITLNLRATGDLSSLTIQTLTSLYRDPVAWTKSAIIQARSLADPNVLGAQLLDFDTNATRSGLPTAARWAKNGWISTGTAAEEFTGGLITKLPVIKQANLAFNNSNTWLSLQRNQGMLMKLIRQGKTVEELEASGEMRRIAQAMNRVVGRTEKSFGGSIGEIAFFAPRFLQSQIETIYKGARGLIPGGQIDDRIATREILHLIAGGVTTTVLINEMMGRPTDFRVVINGRRNPNFMRIRVGGNDVSLFGTWDSLLGAIIDLGTGNYLRAFRSKIDPFNSAVWSLISGADYRGKDTTLAHFKDNPEDILTWMFNSFAPISATSLAQELPKAKSATDIGVTTTAALVGLKAAPLSVTDIRQIVTQELIDGGVLPKDTDVDNLKPGVARIVNQDSRVVDAVSQRGTKPQDFISPEGVSSAETRTVSDNLFKLSGDFLKEQIASDDRLARGTITGKDWREAHADQGKKYRGALQVLGLEHPTSQQAQPRDAAQYYKDIADILAHTTDNNIRSIIIVAGWRAIPFDDAVPENPDFDKFFKMREEYKASLPPIDRQLLEGYLAMHMTPTEQAWDKARDTLRPYWSTADKVLGQWPDDLALYKEWVRATANQKGDLLAANRWMSKAEAVIAKEKKAIRFENPNIDDALVYWYGYKAIQAPEPKKQRSRTPLPSLR